MYTPGITAAITSTEGYITPESMQAKLIVVMVGLPARGKSYTARKLARYLNWMQLKTHIFNAGQRRRTTTFSPSTSKSAASFFDPNDNRCVAMRDQIALDTLDEMLHWLIYKDGCVGIFDATNNTHERRKLVVSHIGKHLVSTINLMFLECSCTDPTIIHKNLQLKLKGPDYDAQPPDVALEDLNKRVMNYEQSYVPLGESERKLGIPYVNILNVGQMITTHLIRGFLSTQVVEYLLNFHLEDRQIWITCNGESTDDAVGRIGRSADLSDHGRDYAQALVQFTEEQRREWDSKRSKSTAPASGLEDQGGNLTNEDQRFMIWTSMMPQTIQTATAFPNGQYVKRQTKLLDDLNPGHFAGMTFSEIAKEYPNEFAARKRNSISFRWSGQGGEAYGDVINRLRGLIIELERMRDHVLLITHRAVVRALLAYFLGLQRNDLAEMEVPKDTVFCFEPHPYGIAAKAFQYDESTKTFAQAPQHVHELLV